MEASEEIDLDDEEEIPEENENGEAEIDDTKANSKWTPEVIETQTVKYEEKMKITIQNIRTNCEANTDLNAIAFKKSSHNLMVYYSQLKDAKKIVRLQFRMRLCRVFEESGIIDDCSTLLCKIYEIGGKMYFKDEQGSLTHMKTTFRQLLGLIFNFTDKSESFCKMVCRKPNFMELLQKIQTEWLDPYFQLILKPDAKHILYNSIALPYNILMKNDSYTLQIIREMGMLQTVTPYLEAPYEVVKRAALLFVAFCVDEKEAGFFQGNSETLKGLVKLLKTSLKNKMGKGAGYSTDELLRVMNKLAKNDVNKRLLVMLGLVPVLKMALEKCTDEADIVVIIDTLWTLAFEKMNRDEIMQACGEDLRMKWANYGNPKIQQKAKGANFVLGGRVSMIDENGIKEAEEKPKSAAINEKKHIMISYNHDSLKMVTDIREQLRTLGYKVWIDFEQMEGSTLETMAKAIEDAWVVLICYARKYKESPNCRVEGEYTFSRKIPFVPLLMEEKYKPDGWLGLMIGTKLYYDFSGRKPFQSKIDELSGVLKKLFSGTKEIGQAVVAATKNVADASNALNSVAAKAQVPKDNLASWKSKDVKKWCLDNKLNWEKLKSIKGSHLMFLKRLQTEAPEFFYRAVEVKLQQISLDEIMRFVEAFDKL